MGSPHEGSIRRPIGPWANALTTELHLAPADAPNPAQCSVVWYTKVVTQNMKVCPTCLKNQCWKQLKKKPSLLRMTFGLASNNFIYLLSNTATCVGCLGIDLVLEAYCRDSFARPAPKQGSCASTYKLSTGEVLNAARQSLRTWRCTRHHIYDNIVRT